MLLKVYDRINLDDMGSLGMYEKFGNEYGLGMVEFTDHGNIIGTHYGAVSREYHSSRHAKHLYINAITDA